MSQNDKAFVVKLYVVNLYTVREARAMSTGDPNKSHQGWSGRGSKNDKGLKRAKY